LGFCRKASVEILSKNWRFFSTDELICPEIILKTSGLLQDAGMGLHRINNQETESINRDQ